MIDRFFECLVPISKCNLKCEYCYVIQENRRNIQTPNIVYSIEQYAKAIAQERVGYSFFSFCGYGETLLKKELIIPLVFETLKNGHIVNITNNGTMTDAINMILGFPKEYLDRLLFSFSLHYDELKKRKLLSVFSSNVNRVLNSRASCFVQINLCDSYISKTSEISNYCLSEFGYLPQVALTRSEGNGFSIYSSYSFEEYKSYGNMYDSPLFDYTCRHFNIKRKEFCHAGDNSFSLDLSNGDLRRCYNEDPFMNLFDESIKVIPCLPIGKHCGMKYCLNSSHFLSLGNIRNHDEGDTYSGLRNRGSWIKKDLFNELACKFENNENVKQFHFDLLRKGFFIYGAGKAANEISSIMLKKGIKPQLIVVSRMSEDQSINGIIIREYQQVKELVKNLVCIIAIKDYGIIMRIKEELEKDDIKKIYTYYDVIS